MTMDRYRIDRETLLPWVEVAQSSRMMRDTLSGIGDPLAGSNFELANAMYPFEPTSVWCRGYLDAALEHLELWADHVAPMVFAEGAVVIQRGRPAQTLSRAAVEAAAQAVWIMDADNARECARRHLSLVLHDLDEEAKAAQGAEQHRVLLAREELLAWLAPAITEKEIGGFLGYMQLVKRASAIVAKKGSKEGGLDKPDEVERLWRTSAGSAHGKRWPSLKHRIVLHSGDGNDTSAPGVYVPDPVAITRILKLADAVVTYGVVRFADYSGFTPQLASILAAANQRLADRIPRIDG
jgi:hypothetical protein